MDGDGVGSSVPKFDCLLFDLDDTLYPLSMGLNSACRANIEEFMLHHLHIEETRVPEMCLRLYRDCGTTMAGLKELGYEFDNDEYHAYVHGRLPYDVLTPDPVLRNLLSSMPQRKIIFTNADSAHARRALKIMGLEECFDGIICFETLNPPSEAHSKVLCKPSLEALQAAIEIAGADPAKTVFFDDSPRNIATGKAAGLETVIVGKSEVVEGADHALISIHNMREALPQLWETEAESPVELHIHPASATAAVRA